jgi:hypothetical protein
LPQWWRYRRQNASLSSNPARVAGELAPTLSLHPGEIISARMRIAQERGRVVAPKPEVEMVLASSGWWLGSILFLVIWIAIAFWPARVAGRKGHSFFGYFVFSLIFFPAALIVAYMVSDRRTTAY